MSDEEKEKVQPVIGEPEPNLEQQVSELKALVGELANELSNAIELLVTDYGMDEEEGWCQYAAELLCKVGEARIK